MIVDLRE